MLYLGTLAANNTVVNETTTAAPFAIPTACTKLIVQVEAQTTLFVATSKKDAAFAPAAAAMLAAGAAGAFFEVTLPPGGSIACRNSAATAGLLKVFAKIDN